MRPPRRSLGFVLGNLAQLLLWLVIIIVIVLVPYLCMAFGFMDLNPFSWPDWARAVWALLQFLWVCVFLRESGLVE